MKRGKRKKPKSQQARRGHGHGEHVLHLAIDMPTSLATINQYLLSCPNLIDLALWTANAKGAETLALLDALPSLTRLCVWFHTLTDSLTLDNPTRLRPCFAWLTHLDMANPCLQWDDWQGLANVGREMGG